MTVEVNSTMTTRQSIAVAQVIPLYRYTEGLGRRRLLTRDEVLRLPNEQLLIIIRGQKLLRARKFDYTGHPYAKEMVRVSVRDYRAAHKEAPTPEPAAPEFEEADQQMPVSHEPPVQAATQQAAAPPEPAPVSKQARHTKTLYEQTRPPQDF